MHLAKARHQRAVKPGHHSSRLRSRVITTPKRNHRSLTHPFCPINTSIHPSTRLKFTHHHPTHKPFSTCTHTPVELECGVIDPDAEIPTVIMEGHSLADNILDQVKSRAEYLTAKIGREPCLCVIIVGERPDSVKYVNVKRHSARLVGINTRVEQLPETTTQQELIQVIQSLNNASSVDGIIIQLPLPHHLDASTALQCVTPIKDVDGFHLQNQVHLLDEEKVNIGAFTNLFPGTSTALLYCRDQNTHEISFFSTHYGSYPYHSFNLQHKQPVSAAEQFFKSKQQSKDHLYEHHPNSLDHKTITSETDIFDTPVIYSAIRTYDIIPEPIHCGPTNELVIIEDLLMSEEHSTPRSPYLTPRRRNTAFMHRPDQDTKDSTMVHASVVSNHEKDVNAAFVLPDLHNTSKPVPVTPPARARTPRRTHKPRYNTPFDPLNRNIAPQKSYKNIDSGTFDHDDIVHKLDSNIFAWDAHTTPPMAPSTTALAITSPFDQVLNIDSSDDERVPPKVIPLQRQHLYKYQSRPNQPTNTSLALLKSHFDVILNNDKFSSLSTHLSTLLSLASLSPSLLVPLSTQLTSAHYTNNTPVPVENQQEKKSTWNTLLPSLDSLPASLQQHLRDIELHTRVPYYNSLKFTMPQPSPLLPCTPLSCIALLDYYNIDLVGSHVVVLGRSSVVGFPLSLMLMQRGAVVTNLDRNCPENVRINLCQNADVIVTAVGKANFIDRDSIKPGCVIIDVGINFVSKDEAAPPKYKINLPKRRYSSFIAAKSASNSTTSQSLDETATAEQSKQVKTTSSQPKATSTDIHTKNAPLKNMRLVGDTDFDDVLGVAGMLTPVPGGVGPVTVAMLLRNTVLACDYHNQLLSFDASMEEELALRGLTGSSNPLLLAPLNDGNGLVPIEALGNNYDSQQRRNIKYEF